MQVKGGFPQRRILILQPDNGGHMDTSILRATALAAALAAGSAFAQGGPGYGYGPGQGAGMMGGNGMMGGGMMGGGRGAMMGGYGQGYGPGAGGGIAALNLSDDQREKIVAIQEDNRRKNWDTMGQVRSEMFRLRSMYFADKVDAKAYADQQKKVDDLRGRMLASRLEARNQIDQVLNAEQRKQFRAFGPWWQQDEAE
jgi:protein CpxP